MGVTRHPAARAHKPGRVIAPVLLTDPVFFAGASWLWVSETVPASIRRSPDPQPTRGEASQPANVSLAALSIVAPG